VGVPLLSPGFPESEWCTWEANAFLYRHENGKQAPQHPAEAESALMGGQAEKHKRPRRAEHDRHFSALPFLFHLDMDKDDRFAPMRAMKKLQTQVLKDGSFRFYICEQLLPIILEAVGEGRRALRTAGLEQTAGAGAVDDPVLAKGSKEQVEAIRAAYEVFLSSGKKFTLLPSHHH
jgi:hypothetical protein